MKLSYNTYNYKVGIKNNYALKFSTKCVNSEIRRLNPLSKYQPRPPVVAILGHVDHGKTTLLDALRASRIVDEEYGGITQHLAAFTVSLQCVALNSGMNDPNVLINFSDKITFLDTPGHAAFKEIRSRSTKVTDIMLLVVAADDGVKPQTVEAIRFAKLTNTPIVVAINKIDKPGLNMNYVIDSLAKYGVVTEKLGGPVQAVPISALKRRNLSNLMEALIVQAELMQIKSDPDGPAEAVVLESQCEPSLGKTATCLVIHGQLKVSSHSGPLLSGEALCTPRILLNDMGDPVKSVSPGFVAKVAGWKQLPLAGSTVLELESIAKANQLIRERKRFRLDEKCHTDREVYDNRLEEYRKRYHEFVQSISSIPKEKRKMVARPDYSQTLLKQQNQHSVVLIIKCDVQGSVEAIESLLSTCHYDLCRIEINQLAVGPLTESDVEAAKAVNAHILLFNTNTLAKTSELAKANKIPVTYFNIIYRLAEHVRDLLAQYSPKLFIENVVGEAEILQLFEVTDKSYKRGKRPIPVAGCRCTKGFFLSHLNKANTILNEREMNDLNNPVSIYYRVMRKPPITTNEQQTTEDELLSNTYNPDAVLVSQASCHSLRHEKNNIQLVRKGSDCGLVLTSFEDVVQPNQKNLQSHTSFVSNWQIGDVVQCYVINVEIPKVSWEFETKSMDEYESNE